MSSLGVPPTIPNVADLQNMGADYMARVAAEELGAGGVLETAEAVYGSMPDNVQGTIKENSGEIGNSIADSLAAGTGAETAAAAGNFYIPDPLYYKAHPATVIVKVSNPNNEATDRVTISVKDSAGLYRPSRAVYVPPLGPGESTVIPVVIAPGQIAFTDIVRIVDRVMSAWSAPFTARSLQEALAADAQARRDARSELSHNRRHLSS